jgi:hypothetical protein
VFYEESVDGGMESVNRVTLCFSAELDVWDSQSSLSFAAIYESWNFNSGNYLFTTDTK